MNLTQIKFTLLLVLIPFFSIAKNNLTTVPIQLAKIGMDVNTLNNIKSKSFDEGEHYVLRNVIKINGLKFKEIKMVWKQDSLYSLTCVLDNKNGTKLLNTFIKEYGVPLSSGVLDIHEWFTERNSISFNKQDDNLVIKFRVFPFHKNLRHQEEFNWDKLTD